MALIIKELNRTAPEGSDELYRDALVSNGTIGLIDLSNLYGTVSGDVTDGALIPDLAREAAEEEGVINNFNVDTLVDLVLTPGKGFSSSSRAPGQEDGFINVVSTLGGLRWGAAINPYLATNQPKTLFIVWGRRQVGPDTTGQFIRSAGEATNNFRMNHFQGGGFTLFVAGVQISGNTGADGELFQIAVEHLGAGQKPNTYLNGIKTAWATVASSAGFVSSSDTVFGNYGEVINSPMVAYRMLIEDLDVSGRIAADVVRKDFEYVTATGNYAGITKRPFVDTF